MKRGFIMPVVLLLMTMLMGVTLVLSKMAENKTKALKNQEASYYSGKEIVIELVEEGEEPYDPADFFSKGLSTYCQENPSGEDGMVIFDGDSKYRNNFSNKVAARLVENKGYPWQKITCVDTQDGNDDWCIEDTDLWAKETKLELPEYRESAGSSGKDNVNLGFQEEKTLVSGDYKDIKMASQTKLTFVAGSSNVKSISTGSPSNIEFGSGVYNIDSIDMGSGTDIVFGSGTYYIKSLKVGSPGTLYMEPGDYWIESISTMNESKVVPLGSGTVRIYLKDTNINYGTDFNFESKDPAKLLIIAYEDFKLGNNNPLYGAVYGEKVVSLDNRAKVWGSVKAKTAKYVNWSGVEVIWDDRVQNINYGEVAGWITSDCDDEDAECWW